MFERFRHSFQNRRFGFRTITMATAAIAIFLSGFVVSGGGYGISQAAVGSTVTDTQKGPEHPAVSSPFTPLVKELSPTVVNVKVSKIEKAGPGEMQMPWGAPFGDFFNQPHSRRDQKVQGAGSGVIISGDGYLLTNNHVVEGATEVDVTLADKREFKARIVGRDPKTDLAIVKIDAGENLPAAKIGDSSQLQVGDWVFAIGNPFGLSHTVTSGIVSAKGRVIGAGPYDDFIQTDASINPGNSGGPLFNMRGEVVGINTAIIPNGQGIGFAIPIDTAKPLIPQLVERGEVTRGYIGVSIQSITPDIAKAMKLEQNSGALVADVIDGGPADKAGIKAGDVIVSFDGKPVQDSHDLPAMVAAAPVGGEVPLKVVREGKERKFVTVIAKLNSDDTPSEEGARPARGKWGLQLRDLNPRIARELGLKDEQGVLVADIEPDSPAARAAITRGDVIVEVNRQQVKSVNDLKDKIAKSGGDSLLLLVKNAQGSRYVVLKG
ncbi:MAG: DegQ family serine endoprotease [Syntrophobacter sp.]